MIYEPREDSELLAAVVSQRARGSVLDMGTGSGIQAQTAQKNPEVTEVLAADINPEAVQRTQELGIQTVLSDKFTNISDTFDTIICNTPYLPDEPLAPDMALDGGVKGYEWTLDFLSQAKKYLKSEGHILLLISTLTNPHVVQKHLLTQGYEFEVVDSLKVSFEELLVYDITRGLPNHLQAEYLAHGKRSVVYKSEGEVIKKSEERRVAQEVKMLSEVNALGIGPKLHSHTNNTITMEFVDGERIDKYLETAEPNDAEKALLKVLEQCKILDENNINKSEMKNPYKHIIVTKNGPVMIDWERAKYSQRPQNTTQFHEYLKKIGFEHLIKTSSI